ncbi:MAG: hypothetical protein ACRYG4_15790 [Janthinobacterium lividum]
MDREDAQKPVLHRTGLSVDSADGEIVLDGAGSGAPSMTGPAARETARRLVKAADDLPPIKPVVH